MKNLIASFFGLCVPLCFTGCEVNVNAKEAAAAQTNTTSTSTSTPASSPITTNNATPTNTTPPVVAGADDLNISTAVLLGPHKSVTATRAGITRVMYSANIEGDKMRMSFDPLNWQQDNGTDAGVYIFWIETGGQVLGGWFDWHGTGQTVKGLENIYGGYLDGQKPRSGQPVYFALVNFSGTERTNVRLSNTPWP